ncbi:MAG: head-tail adaptor protein [Chloroflexi bacterium]|nr:MAG: head-tail adaptor protein [Chloroflexota bacterium]
MADFAVNAGELRTLITFQQPTIVKDPGGAQKETYANVPTNPTVRAKWVNDHGDESVTSDAGKSIQRATVTIRHRSDVLETWQVLKGGEAWKILSVDPVQGRNRWVVLRVERVKGTV